MAGGALSPILAEALWQHRRGTAYRADEDYVFAHPTRGTAIQAGWFAEKFRAALKAAGIDDYVRPFHDLRHASLTNGVVAGEQPLEVMTRAGHRESSTRLCRSSVIGQNPSRVNMRLPHRTDRPSGKRWL